MTKNKKSRKLSPKGLKISKVFKLWKNLIILILFIILAIVLVCVWYRNHTTSKTVYILNPTPTFQPTPYKGTSTPTLLPYKEPTRHETKRAVIQDGYAMIPELEIKFKVTNDLETLLYTMHTFYGPEYQNYGTSFADFSTESLLKMNVWCRPDEGAIGVIGRSFDNPYGLGSGPVKEDIKQIGEYYYHYIHPQAACSDDKDAQIVESRQIQLLKEAFQTIESVK